MKKQVQLAAFFYCCIIGSMLMSCSKAEVTPIDKDVISYKTRISPIIGEKCLDCHDMDSNYPMATYEQMVQEANTGNLTTIINEEHLHIPFPASLEQYEKQLINTWVDQQFPE